MALTIIPTPWVLYPGADFAKTVRLKDGADAAIDLAGYSATMDIVKYRDKSGAAVLQLTVGSGITINSAAGEYVFAITAAQTTPLIPHETLVGDLVTTDAGGLLAPLFRVFFTVPQPT